MEQPCDHGSSGSRSISQAPSGKGGIGTTWVAQSCTWNWIQAAASRFRPVAGTNSFRAISRLLIVRGLGLRMPGPASGRVSSSGTLRPNRRPALPIRGSSRSLKRPAGWRAVTHRGLQVGTWPDTGGSVS
jgi:hypothetical protein